MNGDLSATASRLVALLAPHTPFAEAIVKRQADRAGVKLSSLGREHLEKIGPMIVQAAAVFVDPTVLVDLKRQLNR